MGTKVKRWHGDGRGSTWPLDGCISRENHIKEASFQFKQERTSVGHITNIMGKLSPNLAGNGASKTRFSKLLSLSPPKA